MRRVVVLVVALVLGVMAGGCGGGDLLGVDLGGTWVLESGTGPRGPVEVPPDARVDLVYADGQFRGTAACNSYFADVDRDGAAITIGGVGATEMACDEPRMAAESAYLAALPEVTEVARDGDTLTLSGDGVELVFTFEPPEPDAALAGTTWHLDTLVLGDAASTVRGDPATLELAEDGTFRASTGCRSLAGAWTRGDGTLTFSDVGVDEVECDELSGQDGHVVDVLTSADVQVEVDGRRLTLTDGGHGLGYSASEG